MFKAEGISCMKMYEIYTIVIVIGTVVLMMDLSVNRMIECQTCLHRICSVFFGGCSLGIHFWSQESMTMIYAVHPKKASSWVEVIQFSDPT